MLSEDFVPRVAFEPFGAAVPTDDAPARVQHEDRVVLDPFDQQPKALLALAQRLFGLFALGQVAGDFEKAAQGARGRLQGRDGHVGPEARAVLAQPPAFVKEAAGLGRHFEFVFRPAALEGLGRIKDGEVSAEDLLGFIAFEPLGPGVPTGHVAARIEQKDRVILDAGHDFAEMLLGLGRYRRGVVRSGRIQHTTIRRLGLL
jgi:hypothetical protein